jgi:hypothetical protein
MKAASLNVSMEVNRRLALRGQNRPMPVGDRAHKECRGQYQEGRFLITGVGTTWVIDEMSEFDGEPGRYDSQCLSDMGIDFERLQDARAWCKRQLED